MPYSYKSTQSKPKLPMRLKVIALLLIFVLAGATVLVRYQYDQNLRPVSSSHAAKYITIAPGSSTSYIAKQLYAKGLIRDATTFELYVSTHQYRDNLQAGTYEFKPSQTTPQIVDALVNGKVATNLVTILPGQRLDQVKTAFIKAGFKPAAVDMAFQANQYRGAFPALADNPPNSSLEGFLYPDSFQKTATTDPKQIVEESLIEMQSHLNANLRKAFAKEGLTTYQGVTLASIIEKEVSRPADKPKVAQVLLKRLSLHTTLGSDVTAYYGAISHGYAPSLKYDSPYNTLLHPGLPPGPISTVGADSLKAAAYPAKTDWLYFVTGDNGNTYFSKTLKDHEALTKQYCHKLCGQPL